MRPEEQVGGLGGGCRLRIIAQRTRSKEESKLTLSFPPSLPSFSLLRRHSSSYLRPAIKSLHLHPATMPFVKVSSLSSSAGRTEG